MTSLASNWFSHLLQALWQDTAVALIVLALLRVMRRASPQLRHALVLLALLKFSLPPMLPLPTGVFSAGPEAPAIESIGRVVGAATAPLMAPFLVALMFLHIGGAGWAMLRLAFEALRLRGIRRRATSRAGILVSPEISVPMAAGMFRPFILLPESLVDLLSPAELADVVAHEREHVRRRDVLFNWLQELILAVWWFHPLVARLGREARALREECCDDALLARGACESAHYAKTLLRAAAFASSPPLPAAAIAESESALLQRVRRIADADFSPAPRLSRPAVAFMVLLALLLLPGLRVSSTNRYAFDRETFAALTQHSHRH